MAMLLGSRGRARKNGGAWSVARGLWQSVFGRSTWRDERPNKVVVSGWIAAIGVLGAFACGWLAGDHFGAQAPNELATKARVEPGFLGEPEAEKLASNAFIVSIYDGDSADDKAHAKALARWLQGKGLAKSRPYLAPIAGGSAWTVAVYYDGDAEFAATRDRLLGLPEDVPCGSFCSVRKSEAVWPRAMAVQ